MKAVLARRYGGPEVLKLEEMSTPSPRAGEVLVKVAAASLNAADWRLLRGDPFLIRFALGGPFRPRLRALGIDVAGRVEAIGAGVSRLRVGDAVFGDLSTSGFGAFAEYVCAPERALAAAPPGLSLEEAAALPCAGLAALHGLRERGRLAAGEQVLVNGAGGGVGHFAVQIAKAMGAEVTAVASARKLDFLRKLGADHLLDYAAQDFTRGGARYDLILDAAAHRPFWVACRALAPGGRYVLVGGANRSFPETILLGPLASAFGGRKTGFVSTKPSLAGLESLKELVEAGKLRPRIDRRFPLAELPEAIRLMEAGQVRGKLIVGA